MKATKIKAEASIYLDEHRLETPVKLTTPGRFNLTTCAGAK